MESMEWQYSAGVGSSLTYGYGGGDGVTEYPGDEDDEYTGDDDVEYTGDGG